MSSRTHSSRLDCSTGFTLIELLAVIGIIALLAALIFPVFAKVREKGRQTGCLSNFRQVSLAFHLYSADFDEVMPPAQTGKWASTDWASGYLWPQLLAPYHSNWQVFACPSDPSATDTEYGLNLGVRNNAPARQLEFARAYFSDIGYNYIYLAPPPDSEGRQPPPASLSAIRDTAATILSAESSYNRESGPGICFIYPPTVTNYWLGEQTAGASPFGFVWPRHLKLANVAFVDGHSKSLSIETLRAGVNPTTGTIVDPAACYWDLK